ncbi:MAG: PIG-L deacetylase family protein [Solirubrobacterales bacterium]
MEIAFISHGHPLTMNVLALGAHPDDVEIGCGGALALHADAGDRVAIACATSGEAGSTGVPPSTLARIRREEAAAAAAVLGATELRFLGFADGRLAWAGYDLVAALAILVRELRPELVYAPHPADAHPDHAALAAAAIDAVRRAGAHAFPELGEFHRADALRLYEVWTPLAGVAVTVDISGVADRKAAAIRCHASQRRTAAFDEIALGLNRYRSILLRTATYVEAFGAARTAW